MSNPKESTEFLAYSGIIAIAILGLILKGWVLAIMWSWFVVPVFNVPQLTIPAALGIVFMMNLVVMHFNLQQTEIPPIERLMKVVMEPLIVLLFGWVAHLFV